MAGDQFKVLPENQAKTQLDVQACCPRVSENILWIDFFLGLVSFYADVLG